MNITYNNKIKVLVVVNHPVIMEGLVAILSSEPRILVVGKARNGEECLQLTFMTKPDVILLDIGLLNISKIDLVEKLNEIKLQIKVIMLMSQKPKDYLMDTLVKRTQGFLIKECTQYEIIQAVFRVFDGKIYFSQELITNQGSLINKAENEMEAVQIDSENHYHVLTPREIEVIELISEGLLNKEIAIRLGIKIKTVEFHVSNILLKLGVGSRLEAVLSWIKQKNL